MTPANWISLIVVISGGLLVAGGLLVRVKVAESAIKEFARAREKQGERIGGCEERIALLEGAGELDGPKKRTRRRTRPGGVPVSTPTEESGS